MLRGIAAVLCLAVVLGAGDSTQVSFNNFNNGGVSGGGGGGDGGNGGGACRPCETCPDCPKCKCELPDFAKRLRNKRIAVRMVSMGMTDPPATVWVEDQLADDFKDHEAAAGADIKKHKEEYVARTRAIGGNGETAVVFRSIADGDYVFVHARMDKPAYTPIGVRGDVFKFTDDGKIEEHWGIRGGYTPAFNSTFLDPVTNLDALPENQFWYTSPTEQNKADYNTLVNLGFNERDEGALRRYIPVDYIQHSPRVPGGLEEAVAFVKVLGGQQPYRVNYVQMVLGEGDLVLILGHTVEDCRATDNSVRGGTGTSMNIGRFQNGKLQERWIVRLAGGNPDFPTVSKNPLSPFGANVNNVMSSCAQLLAKFGSNCTTQC